MDRKLTCLITGKSYQLAQEYYKKKIDEYKDEDALKSYFITKKAKQLIQRGYTVDEIRNMVDVEPDLIDSNDERIIALVEYHKIKTGAKKSSSKNFNNHKSDPDVRKLIKHLKTKS